MTEIQNTETHALTQTGADWSLPDSLDKAKEIAEYICNSGVCPKAYVGKPNDAVVAMMMGHQVGLAPMQALQNIAVIQGTPAIWGDAIVALCLNHPKWDRIEESFDQASMTATCKVWRKGNESPCVRTFSQADADTAGLWNRNTWKQYPKRMLQIRARAFALRDTFADALKGLGVAEEVMDTPEKFVAVEASVREGQPQMRRGVAAAKARLGIGVDPAEDAVVIPGESVEEPDLRAEIQRMALELCDGDENEAETRLGFFEDKHDALFKNWTDEQVASVHEVISAKHREALGGEGVDE